MKLDDINVCNVCLKTSKDEPGAVFIKATKNGEDVDICTSCIPHIIHSSGDVVKSNEEVKAEVEL